MRVGTGVAVTSDNGRKVGTGGVVVRISGMLPGANWQFRAARLKAAITNARRDFV